MLKSLFLLACGLLTLHPSFLQAESADLVIYGGTPAGIAAGVTAAREGASVVIVEPTKWIGGMVTGGLAKSDIGKQETIGGFPLEFFTRAAKGYDPKFMWYAEPKANMKAFQDLLAEAKVKVITGQRLKAVQHANARITSFTTEDGTTFEAKQFVDASYEGDLMAKASISYIVGREASSQYHESLAGFYPMPIRPRTDEVMASVCSCIGGDGPHYIHGTPKGIKARDDKGNLLFGIYEAKAEPGSADKLTQAYNFRVVVTQRPDIRVPFPKPATYDASRYELLLRLILAYPQVRFGRLFHLGNIAEGKYDLNAQGLFSTDYPGANTAYPDGDWATRDRIWQDHTDFIQGMLWFLGNDERVPKALRDETNEWGLCRDEFTDNNHWPYALYIREGRRMIGEYVMNQKDCQADIKKKDTVGMGSFVIDCHIVQRIEAADGTVTDEGSFQDAPARPYNIAYRSITPKRAECTNLLVPFCFSASHIAYCSMRMEPVYMALGQASGLAAVQAMKNNQTVQEIDVTTLQAKLVEQKAVIDLAVPEVVLSSSLPGIVEDETHALFVGEWISSNFGNPIDGASRHDGGTGQGNKSARFNMKVPKAGKYDVRFAYSPSTNRASKVIITIEQGQSITASATVNQRLTPPPADKNFVSLGAYDFTTDHEVIITVSNKDANGIVSVDAVQLLPQ